MATWTRRSVLGVALLLSGGLLLVPQAAAQCGLQSRQFATIGLGKLGYHQVRIDAVAAENQGNEIGRFWESADSDLGNNFAGLCESQSPQQAGGGWWQLAPTPRRGLRGFVSGTGCQASSCPAGDMTLLIEDVSAPYWPGHAYFMALRVDATPGSQRYWDFSRLDRDPDSDLLKLRPFPKPLLTYISSGLPGELIVRLPDVAANVHSAQGPGNTPLPVSSIVKAYRLYLYHEGYDDPFGDPGREVENWTLYGDYAYSPGGYSTVSLNNWAVCPNLSVRNAYLAVGLTFEGGAGPDVVSRYVGSSLRINCDSGDGGWDETGWPAGAVPDGRFVEGTPLRIAKVVHSGGEVDLTLSWGVAECDAFHFSNSVYEGQLGDFTSHQPVDCQTGSPTTFTPAPGDTYYLVRSRSFHVYYPMYEDFLPHIFAEGSFGRRSDGTERGPGLGACAVTYSTCN